jgi:1-phosphofructokinase family hexose kinase
LIVCLAANPSIDRLFEVDRITVGETHRPLRFVPVAGGKGLNAARAAATLGAEVCVIAILGGNAGNWIVEQLDTERIPFRALWVAGETRSSLSVADRSTREMTEFYERGEPVPESLWPQLLTLVEECLDGASQLTISGSLPPGAPLDGYRRIVALAHQQNVPVILDAAGEYLEHALDADPDFVKVNALEASGLLGVDSKDVGSLEHASELRARAGGEGHAAVITLGSQGIVAAAPDGSQWRGTLNARGSYPVGSGDAFLAGLAVARDRALTWSETLSLALGAAAANAELPGAARLDANRAGELSKLARLSHFDSS